MARDIDPQVFSDLVAVLRAQIAPIIMEGIREELAKSIVETTKGLEERLERRLSEIFDLNHTQQELPDGNTN